MSLVTGIIAYILIWWVVLFAVLPMGVERDPSPRLGNMTGAPKDHKMKQKLIITSLISFVFLFILYLSIEMNVIDFYESAKIMMEED
jgi:predicted secreted protein